jgi:hypothetical protein
MIAKASDALSDEGPGVRPARSRLFSVLGNWLTRGPGIYALVALLSLASTAFVSTFVRRYVPRIHDEFAYLMAGQTFARFELTNPPHPLWRFFETQHILMQPSYMAKYPPGHGLMLAVGYWLGHPIFGVWLESAFLAVAVAWLVRGFFSPRWALVAGLLTISQYGLTYYWTHMYWGGSLTAAGGALVFGGTRRIWRGARPRDALLLGLGIVILMLTRPLEGLLTCVVPAAVFLLRCLRDWRDPVRRPLTRLVLPCGLVFAAGTGFLAYYNFRVTGSPWTLPYLAYEQQYLGAPAFVWQRPHPAPTFITPALGDFYYNHVVPLTAKSPLVGEIAWDRARKILGDFIGWPLAAAAFLALIFYRKAWLVLALLTLGTCALPLFLSYWFLPHYQSPVAGVYVFLAVAGIRALFLNCSRKVRRFGPWLAVIAATQAFALARDHSEERALLLLNLETRRERVEDALRQVGGKHLIFVHLEPPYSVHESWVFNDADIDASQIVWAWDRGSDNRNLFEYYHGRQTLLMNVRNDKVTFSPYEPPPP